MRKSEIQKTLMQKLRKNIDQIIQQSYAIFRSKINKSIIDNFNKLGNIKTILSIVTKNLNKNNGNSSTIQKNLYLVKSPEKWNSTNSFSCILRWAVFLIIQLTTLYDECIDRPKLAEQKTQG